MNADAVFGEAQIERALATLAAWNARSKLSTSSRDDIRALIETNNLECVPIWGAAAIFGVSIVRIRGYLKKNIIRDADIHKNGLLIFDTAELKTRYAAFHTLRRRRYTVAQCGRILSGEAGADAAS